MSEFNQDLVGLIQSIAISHSAWRGTTDALANSLMLAMECEFSQHRVEEIRRLLYSQPLQAALAGRDIALWVGADKLMRLVDQSPSSRKAAILRTQHHPGPKACRFCLILEAARLQPELEPERDARDEIVAGSSVHKQCAAAWRRLRLLAQER